MSTTTTGKNSEEILLSVSDRLEEVQLPEPAPRLALCFHIHVPKKNESTTWSREYSLSNKQRKALQRYFYGLILTNACPKTLATV